MTARDLLHAQKYCTAIEQARVAMSGAHKLIIKTLIKCKCSRL